MSTATTTTKAPTAADFYTHVAAARAALREAVESPDKAGRAGALLAAWEHLEAASDALHAGWAPPGEPTAAALALIDSEAS